jgi:ABC-type antimicrobial peptide transport system permease subunit
VGLYGLVAYAVSRRTKEIGIRMAIGANPRGILRMVLGQGAKLAVFGALAGIALSLGAHRLLTGIFPAGQQIDVAAFLVVLPAVMAITLLAAYIPARRASRTDPIKALRYE